MAKPAHHERHRGPLAPGRRAASTPKPAPPPGTESINPRTTDLDRVDSQHIVEHFIREDKAVFTAVKKAAPEISATIDLVVDHMKKGGRLVYIGAGTSGRLGFIDASECPPTFGVVPNLVTALMAGGRQAFYQAVEGAEDDREAAVADLGKLRFSFPDVLVGIAASGTTPYVRAGLSWAHHKRCQTVLMTCNPIARDDDLDIVITLATGPEVISGSTRLKAGTACKMALNMISSGVMIRLGKVYRNLMVDVVATNKKLQKRARRIVMLGGEVTETKAEKLLAAAKGEVKTAIYLARKGGTPKTARTAIEKAKGHLAQALGELDD